MKERYNIIFMAFIIVFITVNILSVYADSSNSSNSTNSTNSTNKTSMTSNGVVKPMSLTASIDVTPATVDLGTWPADGTKHDYTGATYVTVNASLIVSGTLSVRATSDFINGSNIIPLSYFTYDCPGYVNTERSFTTSNIVIDDYSWAWEWNHRYTMNYHLTIPSDTASGKYGTTIIYTAT